MKQIIIPLLSLMLIALSVQGESFVVEKFTNLKYHRIDNNKKDKYNQPCALLIVKTPIQELSFETHYGITGKVESNIGSYSVYLSPGETKIKISKTGYDTLKYTIPEGIFILSNQTYVMKLSSKSKNKLSLNIEPKGTKVYLNGQNKGFETSFDDLSSGRHTLKITRSGYKPLSDTLGIYSNTRKKYVLSIAETVPVKIDVKPSYANIYLEKEGKKKAGEQFELYPGIYEVVISQDNYKTIEDTISVVTKGSNSFSYKLKKITSKLKIEAIPATSRIWFDNRNIDKSELEITAGKHVIRIEEDNYHPLFDTIDVGKNEEIDKEYKLKPKTGILYTTSLPTHTKIILMREGETYCTYRRDSIFKSIQTGKYELFAEANRFEPLNKKFKIQENKVKAIPIRLEGRRGSRGGAITLSILFPGLGQYASIGQNKRATAYLLTGLGAATFGVLNQLKASRYRIQMNEAKTKYLEATSAGDIEMYRNEMEVAYDKLHSNETARNKAFTIFGLVYGISILDAIIFGGGQHKNSHASLLHRNHNQIQFDICPNTDGLLLGMTIPINRKK